VPIPKKPAVRPGLHPKCTHPSRREYTFRRSSYDAETWNMVNGHRHHRGGPLSGAGGDIPLRDPLPNYELATTSAASSFARMLLIFVPRLLRADSIDGIVLATRSSRKASADAGESAGSVIVWDVEASAS